MTDSPIGRVLSAALVDADTAPDGELLRRFADGKDATAFELLVRRHAELVWGVCRATLPRDPHTAEDVFQAVFLALARKAGTVRDRSAAGWLFRVARNAAVRARGRAADRTTGPLFDEHPAPGESPETTAVRREIGPIVAEEVDRLTARFRDPVVLCFFEGHTHAEAADRLGWSIGTVASRLARAKDQLRARLARRGVAVPAAGLATALAGGWAEAAPVALVRVTVTVAIGPPGAVPPRVHSLVQGALSAMSFTRFKILAAAALACGMTVAAVATTRPTDNPARPGGDGPPNRPTPPAAGAKDDAADELKALQGAWKIVKLTDNGKPAPAERFARVRVVFRGDELSMGLDGADDRMKVRLAPGKSPKQIDLTRQAAAATTSGSSSGTSTTGSSTSTTDAVETTSPGIYERTGNTLTLCLRDVAHLDKGRPKEFAADESTALMVLERVAEADELRAMAGTWNATTASVSGTDLPASETDQMTWVVTANGEVELCERGSDRKTKATLTLDPKATPPTVNLTLVTGPEPERGRVLPGVYDLHGDTLTICLADPKGKTKDARPKDLRAGDGVFRIVFKRVRSEKEELAALAGEWTVMSQDDNGTAVPKDKGGKAGVTFKGDEVVWPAGKDETLTLKVKLDPGRSPKWIDLVFQDKPPALKGMAMLGLYERTGDTLTICLRDLERMADVRPTDLKSAPGVIRMVLERAPKK